MGFALCTLDLLSMLPGCIAARACAYDYWQLACKINLVASVASPWVQLGSLQGAHGPRPRLRANQWRINQVAIASADLHTATGGHCPCLVFTWSHDSHDHVSLMFRDFGFRAVSGYTVGADGAHQSLIYIFLG